MVPFYEVIDDKTYRVFYSLKTKRLIPASEFTSDPVNQYVTTLTGPLPNMSLHNLGYNGVSVCWYNLNCSLDVLVLKDLYYQWFLGMNTPAFLEYVQPAVMPRIRDFIQSLLADEGNATQALDCFKALKVLWEAHPDELKIRANSEARELVRALASAVIKDALEGA